MITTPSQQTRTQTTIPLLALCLGYFMTILDVTIVNIALVDNVEQRSCVFSTPEGAQLRMHSTTKIQRHLKVRERASPYDGNLL